MFSGFGGVFSFEIRGDGNPWSQVRSLHPKPEILNPGTRNPNPGTRNLESETRNPKPEASSQIPNPETRNLEPEIRNPKPETPNPKSEAKLRHTGHVRCDRTVHRRAQDPLHRAVARRRRDPHRAGPSMPVNTSVYIPGTDEQVHLYPGY
jgi:hypothetical protein